MKVLPISDIHNSFQIFDYIAEREYEFDVLLICGDLFEGRIIHPESLVTEIELFQKLIGKPIVMIQGNHDFWSPHIFMDSYNIHMLHNSGVEIDGKTFYGIPQTPRFFNWNHMIDDESEIANQIFIDDLPDNLDVLLSHGPPKGYGDNCNQATYGNNKDSHLGCYSLLHGIYKRKPKHVFCGHIHTGDRVSKMDNGTMIYNVSCLDEGYDFMEFNPAPKVVEI
jgi:Icc-related predicted phosphoesterase